MTTAGRREGRKEMIAEKLSCVRCIIKSKIALRALLKTVFKMNRTLINADKTDFHRFFLMFLEVPLSNQSQLKSIYTMIAEMGLVY